VRSTVPNHLEESALDPRERRARLSDRMDAGRRHRPTNGPTRIGLRGPEATGWIGN